MPLNYDFAIAETPGSDGLARFRDPATAAALRAAPQAVQDFLAECGFGAGAHDSGAPPGTYWSTEESARLAIMERMSENLERYRLPKPGEIPEGGFNLSHLVSAMMAAEPVERPRRWPPPGEAPRSADPAGPDGTGAPPSGRASAGQRPPPETAAAEAARPRPVAPERSHARPDHRPPLATNGPAMVAAEVPAPDPLAPAAPQAGTAPDPAPAPGTVAPAATSAAGPPAGADGPLQRRGCGSGGRLIGILMLALGLGLVLYAVLGLL